MEPTGLNGKVTEEDIRNEYKKREKEKQTNSSFIVAAPSVRKFAREHQVNLEEVIPSGLNGKILKEDIEAVINRRKNQQPEMESQQKIRRKKQRPIRYKMNIFRFQTFANSLHVQWFIRKRRFRM